MEDKRPMHRSKQQNEPQQHGGYYSRKLVTKEQVARTLLNFSVHFKDREIDDAELSILAQDWYESLIDLKIQPLRFERLAQLARQQCNFFPKISEIITIHRDINAQQGVGIGIPTPEPNYSMSDVERIMRGIPGKLKNGKDPLTDYPEYGPSLAELEAMPLEEKKRIARTMYKPEGMD